MKSVKVVYLKKVTDPAYLAGEVDDEKTISEADAKRLIESGHVALVTKNKKGQDKKDGSDEQKPVEGPDQAKVQTTA